MYNNCIIIGLTKQITTWVVKLRQCSGTKCKIRMTMDSLRKIPLGLYFHGNVFVFAYGDFREMSVNMYFVNVRLSFQTMA